MVNNNYPQITSVTSEALQAQIRNLLPSQEGFGTDLMAQNVIVPIIDLTSAAEGSQVAENLQTAYAFGSNTSFDIYSATTTIANTVGFWKITGNAVVQNTSSSVTINMTDGITSKALLKWELPLTTTTKFTEFTYIVWIAAGESLVGISSGTGASLKCTIRQIADSNGTLTNPSGFAPQ